MNKRLWLPKINGRNTVNSLIFTSIIFFANSVAMLKKLATGAWFTYISKWQIDFAISLGNFPSVKYSEIKTCDFFWIYSKI